MTFAAAWRIMFRILHNISEAIKSVEKTKAKHLFMNI